MNDPRRPFAAENIRYGFRQTANGLAVIAASTHGVAAVLLGSDREGLRRKLLEALPGAALAEEEIAIGAALNAVSRYVDQPNGDPGFALDLRGNPGELAVWEALRAIPAGETRTYGTIATALALGLTAQEVGAACAANRLAVVVPCHRVLKTDGSISGYRWGVHRKRKLLMMEKAA